MPSRSLSQSSIVKPGRRLLMRAVSRSRLWPDGETLPAAQRPTSDLSTASSAAIRARLIERAFRARFSFAAKLVASMNRDCRSMRLCATPLHSEYGRCRSMQLIAPEPTRHKAAKQTRRFL